MPVIILERIPLPSLQTYTAFSVVLLSCALFYSHQIVSNVESENIGVPGSFGIGIKTQPRKPEEVSPGLIIPDDLNMDTHDDRNRAETIEEGVELEGVSSPSDPFHQKPKGDNSPVSGVDDAQTTSDEKIEPDTLIDEFDGHVNYTLPFDNYVGNMIYVMTVEIWCVWTLINMAFCCLILLGKVIQKVVFGELRVSELQHLKDKFWNFVFYKFIFVFGVMNVQTMEEVVLWVVWFTMLGFFNLLAQLCKDRFEYLSFSPTTPKLVHVKLLSLLFCILLSCSGLMLVCALVGLQAGITIFSFMTAECLLLGIRLLYVVIRYAIHLWDLNLEGVWENRSSMIYYTELVFELAGLSIDFAHHLHMLLWGNIFLSMASLVICMQLRYLFHEFQRRIKRHKNYLRVVHNMESRFTMGTTDDLEKNNDDCAICWERMEVARKLPCGHLFHNSCLRSWLEQDTSCPTCRMSLNEQPDGDPNGNNVDGRGDAPNNMAPPPPGNAGTTNHFFHFDGSRYVSWLPSFSVEVTHTHLYPGRQGEPNHTQTSQLDNMARQVQDVFPSMPLSTIMQDLRTTFSVDHTIDNILVGRLVQPTQTGTFPARSPDREGTETEAAMATDTDRQLMLPSSVSRQEAETDRRSEELYEPMTSDLDREREKTTPSRSVTNLLDQSQQSNVKESHSSHRREELPSITGSRFSKSPLERETMLQDRKNVLIEQARKKYLSRDQGRLTRPGTSLDRFPEEVSSNSWPGENRTGPRELAFQAAQRRIQQQQH